MILLLLFFFSIRPTDPISGNALDAKQKKKYKKKGGGGGKAVENNDKMVKRA